jgi:RNA polymerase sigma-54 factor
MGIELRQQLKLTQQLIMTPQLQQAIKLLQLSRLELMDAIRQELEENPALDESIDEVSSDNHSGEQEELIANDPAPDKEVTIEEKLQQDVDWSNYLEEYNSPGKTSYEAEERDAPRFESFISRKENLSEHLLWQLLMSGPTEEEKDIGTQIIGNTNSNGYLDAPLQEIAATCGASVEKVEEVLALFHTFNPVGICARSLEECLLLQANHLGVNNTLVTEIIEKHLRNLENKNYKAICRALKINMDEVRLAIQIIMGLEPRPGRQFSDEQPQYITPDIYVYKMEDQFVIMLNEDGMPRLRVNPFYQNTMTNSGNVSDSTKYYMQEKIRSATWLIKSIHQRQKTIYRVMESILKFQSDFFEKGIAYLKPMVLRDVANDIDMHESTISRVTTNKYAYTPQGLFELKYFFNSSINRVDGKTIASVSVQERIKQLVEGEDSKRPYSDEMISTLLKESNINIARRTVAKYREMMGILPSSKRKQIY